MKNYFTKMCLLSIILLLQHTVILWAQQNPVAPAPPLPPTPPAVPAMLDSIIQIGDKEIIIRDRADGKKDKAKVIIDEKGIVIRSKDGKELLIIDDNGVRAKSDDGEFIIDDDGVRTIDHKKNEEHIIIRTERGKDGTEKRIEEKRMIIDGADGDLPKDGEEIDIDIDVEIEGMEERGEKGRKIIKKIFKTDKPRKQPNIKTRWLMLDLGINGYMQDGSFDLSGDAALLEPNYKGNVQVSLHVFKQRVNLLKHHLNLLYGLSFDFHQYNFEQDITLVKNTSPLEILLPSDTEFKRNILKNTYLTMPLLLNFESKPQRKMASFRLNAGVYGGLKIGSRTVQVSEDGDKYISKDGYNLSNFRYGLMGMVGIGPINFTCTYSLQPLFAKNKGPEVYPIGLQIALIPF